MKNQSNPRGSYAPRGLQSDKPVLVRYFPEERSALEQEAKVEGRSISSYVRIATKIGMEVLKERRTKQASAAS